VSKREMAVRGGVVGLGWKGEGEDGRGVMDMGNCKCKGVCVCVGEGNRCKDN
jgi:hypothetical protein